MATEIYSESQQRSKRSQRYPDPLVYDPIHGSEHTKTFIILHGRGSTAHRFGPSFLQHPVPASKRKLGIVIDDGAGDGGTQSTASFRALFPTARFVFPGASTRRATTFKRTPISQWFDMSPLTAPAENEDWMLEGLRETTKYLHALIESEARLVGGLRDVVLGGLSQGCAAALVALLLWPYSEGDRIGAFFGMCGWLPFARRLEDIAKGARDTWESFEFDEVLDDDSNPFYSLPEESHEPKKILPSANAVVLLRQELEVSIPEKPASFDDLYNRTPVFLGHGMKDEKVPVQLGGEAARCLDALGFEVQYKEYAGLAHWFSEEMLQDIAGFLLQSSEACHASDNGST